MAVQQQQQQQPAVAAVVEAQPTAQVVGNAFVHQYYHILHQSPELVYRFYQEGSMLGRPEAEGVMSSVTTMQAINEKILSLDYCNYKAQIVTVDAQDSLNGGVIVLVTGYLTRKDDAKRNFTQSFFLAPQDKGYFVLNDVFRYMEEADPQEVTQGLPQGPVTSFSPEQDITQPKEQQVAVKSLLDTDEQGEANGEEISNPSDNGEGSVVDEEIPLNEPVDKVLVSSQAVAEPCRATVKEETPKKSYASIVKVMSPLSAPAPSAVKLQAANPDRQTTSVQTQSLAPEVAASNSNATDSGTVQEAEDSFSIYIRNLPMNATPPELEEEFKRFGPIKSGGIQVRSHKQQGFCFGFVEFEVAGAVQSAIEASPIMVGGQKAFVEEKRASGSRVNSRGRFPTGRGGFRSDGIRGRGSYVGGRGYGRGDFNNNRVDFGNRGGIRGSSTNRGEGGYQRVDNGSRVNRPGGLGANASKNVAPPVSAPALSVEL